MQDARQNQKSIPRNSFFKWPASSRIVSAVKLATTTEKVFLMLLKFASGQMNFVATPLARKFSRATS